MLPTTLLLLGAGCQEPCRYDADCDTSSGLTRCNLETQVCEPLTPVGVGACSDASDCTGGRLCADGECRFAPSCQRVADGVTFDYIARCSDGAVATGTASASTNGCKIDLTLRELFGADVSVVLEPISAIDGKDAEITTSSDGDVLCPAGTWSAPFSAASLPGCTMPDGLTCDLGVLRRGVGPICLADGTGCQGDALCEPFGPGVADVGGCR